MSQEEVTGKGFTVDNLNFAKSKPAIFYLAIFAGVPLIATIIFLLVIQSFDPTAAGIIIIFSLIIVSMYIFVPRERPEQKRGLRGKKEKVPPKIPEPATQAPKNVTGGEPKQKSKARSRLAEFEAGERKESFVEAVKKTTQHPSAQAQVRRKTKSKSGKKKAKKKRE
jgi:hypothetical protein